MGDCSICCEKFNKSNHKRINCKNCTTDDVIVCQSCAKRYIMEQPTDASCMVCKVEWDTEFLMNNFTKKFINGEFKIHKENYLLERQIALLPDTQEYAEKLKMASNLEKQVIELNIKKKRFQLEVKRITEQISSIQNTIAEIRNHKHKSTNKQFTHKCPMEDCNGFLNEKYECGMCENKICKHCFEKLEEDHECNEEKKETVSMIKKDTKPCPKCGELIYKISGCDQMYCIKCHTAFSWRTGEIERGKVHNPEYYRWMRENGQVIPRDPLDVVYDPCGNNLVPYERLINRMRIYFPAARINTYTYRSRLNDTPETIKILNMHRLANHIGAYYHNNNENVEIIQRDLRAQYLLKNIGRETLKVKLQQLEKKDDKNKRFNNLWNLLNLVIIEYMGKIVDEDYTIEDGIREIKKIIKESEKIRKYFNDQSKIIGRMYNSVYPGVNIEWISINNWAEYVKEREKQGKETE